MKNARCIAVLGTGSDVGKSVIATALCRCLVSEGLRVAPFKAQNMSNNSGVTPDGLEMGRAQIVQAEAAGITPHVDMNPVLLKPTTDVGSQVVLMGKALDHYSAKQYIHRKKKLFSIAAAALDRLRNTHDVVVLEGAGSCAEVNLKPYDMVNFAMAAHAQAPVVLVGDIHRGGIFAQLIGTLACVSPEERRRVAGFIVNRFRGDLSLFDSGVSWIEAQSGKPVFGVVPWYRHIHIESEDSVVLENPPSVQPAPGGKPAIAVIRVPHISNFNDFDPLSKIQDLELAFLESAQRLDAFQGVILPGSKNTRHDLQWLHQTKWSQALLSYVDSGGHITGICGGYQMLGRVVHDPEGIEGAPGSTPGLALLPMETVLKAPKTTTLTRFSWNGNQGLGYEIHMGQTKGDVEPSLLVILERNGQPSDGHDGFATADGRILGTYLHGLFDTPQVLDHWLKQMGLRDITVPDIGGLAARNLEYDRLAEHFIRHVDLAAIKRCSLISV